MILLTGSEGYIGSILQRTDLPLWTCDLIGEPRFRGCFTDLYKLENLTEQITHVIHLAEAKFYEYTAETVRRYKEKNALFFEQLHAFPNLQKVLIASSCSVYGFSDDWADEDSPVQPTSHYAEAKLNLETLAHSAGHDVLILRFGTAYGDSPRPRNDLFINQLITSILASQKMDVYGLDAWRPYVHSYDFARALTYFLKTDTQGIINIVESNYTKRMILELVAASRRCLDGLNLNCPAEIEVRNYKVRAERMTSTGFQTQQRLPDHIQNKLKGSHD